MLLRSQATGSSSMREKGQLFAMQTVAVAQSGMQQQHVLACSCDLLVHCGCPCLLQVISRLSHRLCAAGEAEAAGQGTRSRGEGTAWQFMHTAAAQRMECLCLAKRCVPLEAHY